MVIKFTKPKKEPKTLHAVFFDLDETLIKNNIPVRNLFPRVFSDFQDTIGKENRKAFFGVLQHEIKNLWLTMFESDTPAEQQLVTCFIRAINNTNSISQNKTPALAKAMVLHFFKLGSRNVELHDGALETLHSLSKKKIGTGIITNGIKTLQMGKIKHVGLDKYIDTITISSEARAHKPNKAIFDLALSQANVKAENTWFVGDHVTNDIAGSVQAGMNSVYYNPTNLHVENSFTGVIERPNYTINHLTELLEYL